MCLYYIVIISHVLMYIKVYDVKHNPHRDILLCCNICTSSNEVIHRRIYCRFSGAVSPDKKHRNPAGYVHCLTL